MGISELLRIVFAYTSTLSTNKCLLTVYTLYLYSLRISHGNKFQSYVVL